MNSTSTNRFDVRRFDPRDIDLIEPQESQRYAKRRLRSLDWYMYQERGFALTATYNGEPIAVGGVAEQLPGTGEAWVLISSAVGPPHMIRLFRSFSRILHSELQTAYHRVQMIADADFGPAIRLAEMLGMEQEGKMKDYPVKGKESLLFARVSNGT